MNIRKSIFWVLGLAMMATACTGGEPSYDNENSDTPPVEQYVRLNLFSGCGYNATSSDVELTRAMWDDTAGSGDLTLVWDGVEMDSYNTSALSFVVTDGAQPIVGRTTPEADESAEESTYSGLAVMPHEGDAHHADFQTVNYYSTEALKSAAYCYAVAGDAMVVEDETEAQHLYTLEMPSTFVQTVSQDPSVLGDYMYMYASTTYKEGRTTLNFNHIPATFRFVVTNSKSEAVSLQEISISADGEPVAATTAEVAFSWADGSAEVLFGDESYSQILTHVGDGATLEPGASYTAYAMALPLADDNAFADKSLKVNIKSDGEEALALQLNGSKLAEINGSEVCNWVSGKSYTVKILLREDGKASGEILAENSISISTNTRGVYTLMYEGADGLPLEDYAPICKMTIKDVAHYEDFIKVNVAPREAKTIGIYNSVGEHWGTIQLAEFKPDYTETPMYSFGVLSDVHIGRSGVNAEEDFERALTFFGEAGATMTCICGDISQDGTDAQLSRYQEIASLSEIPVYTTTGNHDCTYNGINISRWTKYTGQPLVFEQSVVREDGKTDHFLFFGMSIWNFSNAYTTENIAWLESKLEEYRNERCFVFTHLFFPDRAGNLNNIYPSGNWLSGAQLARLRNMCDRYINSMWFSGHSHWEWQLQKYQDRANLYRKLSGGEPQSGWCVHVPSCGIPITSNGTSREDNGSGSEGAILQVYKDHVDLLGVDFRSGKYLPIATYRLDTAIREVEAKDDGDSGDVTPPATTVAYITADNFTYNTEKVAGATVADTEGMPGYVDVTFTKKGQGFYVVNDTYVTGVTSVSITVEDVKALSDGVEIDVPANVGFYGGSYYMESTDSAEVFSGGRGVQFQTSNSKYTGPLPLTIRMKVKMVFN